MEPGLVPTGEWEPLRVLTVGEGDLSFSRALQRRFGEAIRLTATTLLEREQLQARYKSAAGAIEELIQAGASIKHGVDACRLGEESVAEGAAAVQDIVVFNYPHLGDAPCDGHSPESEHVRRHCSLLAHFLAAARRVLSPRGQIHVTLCGEQPALWQLRPSAARAGLAELQCCSPADPSAFASGGLEELLPGRRPEKAWGARRKWRNGSLGCVHWASAYGYEHRRHESEQTMNTDHSLAFIFVPAAAEDLVAQMVSLEVPQEVAEPSWCCPVCGLRFDSEVALAEHALAPAVPLESCAGGRPCERCSRWFSSERSLQQHLAAAKCGRPAGMHGGSPPAKGSSAAAADAAASAVLRAEATVTEEHVGSRFLQHARQHAFRELLTSKAVASRALASGELLLNGEAAEETRRLCLGDVLKLQLDRARDGREATLAQARYVRCVATAEGVPRAGGVEGGEAAGWHAVAWQCPLGAAVVWKPAGMRSLGEHAGTLQAALPLLPALAGAERPRPVSRLEIGCAGLALAALGREAHAALAALVAEGRVAHCFRAEVRGRLGEAEECLSLRLPRQGSDATEAAAEVRCRVVRVLEREARGPEGPQANVTSVLELSTTACAGRCCGLLCLMLRLNGTPVIGDRNVRRRAAAATDATETACASGRRRLRLECIGIRIEAADAGDMGPLDVRICRTETPPR